jgi:hypothetical protein
MCQKPQFVLLREARSRPIQLSTFCRKGYGKPPIPDPQSPPPEWTIAETQEIRKEKVGPKVASRDPWKFISHSPESFEPVSVRELSCPGGKPGKGPDDTERGSGPFPKPRIILISIYIANRKYIRYI